MARESLAELALAVRTVRLLAVDMVEAARSGHPGAPLGLAPLATALWARALRFDPGWPGWPDRDRFVLSCGHASALLYALLHLAGFDLSLEELRRFRQLGSKTPGHPEHGLTPGVETTTGPLGQGFATAVGMAIAQRHLAARFNRPGAELFTYRTWVLASDGDLMEGLSHEAASLAGHQRLDNLIVFWDDNRVTIDGSTDLAWSEDVPGRFRSYGWETAEIQDGNDLSEILSGLELALRPRRQPLLCRVRTVIGYGSPRAGTAAVHGAPLGPEGARATREFFGASDLPPFTVPDEARAPFERAARQGRALAERWRKRLDSYRLEHPGLASELDRRLAGRLPEGWDAELPRFEEPGSLATRAASGRVLAGLGPRVPELFGGSADLSESNQTEWPGAGRFAPDRPEGRYLHFGVREHAMGAILNGLALSGLIRPFGGTFLVFSDYLRPALRLAALMELPVVFVFTHDSIFLGEDGPTHQPIEHLAALRAIPNLWVVRPADASETVAAWQLALERRDGPVALVLTRQKVPTVPESARGARSGVRRGGYVVREPAGGSPLDLLLLATGSEVCVALEAASRLDREGIRVRVVSLPCWELFSTQDRHYRESVLPPGVPRRVALEAATGFGWERWLGPAGFAIGLERFGRSAPAESLAEALGFTAEAVVAQILGRWPELAGGRAAVSDW